MLNTNHPDTDNIFEAAAIEEEIRAGLVKIKAVQKYEYQAIREEILNVWIPELQVLNMEKFGNNASINKTLDALANTVKSGSPDQCWEAFMYLAEKPGDNFGTWAI